jgi:hypothetical protein
MVVGGTRWRAIAGVADVDRAGYLALPFPPGAWEMAGLAVIVACLMGLPWHRRAPKTPDPAPSHAGTKGTTECSENISSTSPASTTTPR